MGVDLRKQAIKILLRKIEEAIIVYQVAYKKAPEVIILGGSLFDFICREYGYIPKETIKMKMMGVDMIKTPKDIYFEVY